METAFVFLVFIRIFVEVGGKGELFEDPWTPLVERFNEIMKGIEENGGKKDMLDSVLIESIEDVIYKDCKDGVIKEVDGPISTDVPGVFTKMYALSHPRDWVEQQSFWILPSVECRAKVIETPVAFIDPRAIPQDTRKMTSPSTNQGLNQPIGNQNPASNAETNKKLGNSNVGPPPPPSNPKYVIVENPDGGKVLGVVASPFKPSPAQIKQPDKGNQGKLNAPPPSQPGREHKIEDRVDPYKVKRPQPQRNQLNEESGKTYGNDLPPFKHTDPLTDKTGYSKLLADGLSGSQNAGQPGREHEIEDRVDPYKVITPQLQRNPLHEGGGKDNLNGVPPVKQPYPLSDKTGYSKLPADGLSGSQNTGQPGREHEIEDRVDPYKVITPQLQRNPLHEGGGKDNLNVSPPVKQPYPLSDKTGYSKLPADGFSGNQNTARANPYDHLQNQETHPNTDSNIPESKRNIDVAPLNQDNHDNIYREPYHKSSHTLPSPPKFNNKGVLEETQPTNNDELESFSDKIMGVGLPRSNQDSTKESPYGGKHYSGSSKDSANNSEMPFLPIFVNGNPEEISNLRKTFSDTEHSPNYGVPKQPVTHKDHNKDLRETSSLYDIDKRYEGDGEPLHIENTPDNQYRKEKLRRDDKVQVNNPTYTKPGGNEFEVIPAKPKIGKDVSDLDNVPFLPIDYPKKSYDSSMHPATNSAPFTGKENPIMKKTKGADSSELQRTPSKDNTSSKRHKSTPLDYIPEGNPNRNELYQSIYDDPKKTKSPEKSSPQYEPSPSFHKGQNAERKHSFNGKDSQAVQISPQDIKSSQKQNSEENESSDFSEYLDDSESDERAADTVDKKGKQRPVTQPETPPKRKPLKPVLATNEEIESFIEKQRRKWREEEKNL